MNRDFGQFPPRILAGAVVLALAACGGGDDEDGPARGSVIGAPTPVTTLSTAQIDSIGSAQGVSALTGPAKCSVSLSTIEYNTVGGKGEATNATAAVMVPGGGAGCTGARPVLLYAHGTAIDKRFDSTDLEHNPEPRTAMAFFAAQGYLVVAPNYTGYHRSKLPYHPYLNAEAQSRDVIDALRAARSSMPNISTTTSFGKQLFVAGYSQGGHVAMATARALQNDYSTEFKLAGSVPMSGPYALGDAAKASFNGEQVYGASIFLPMLVDSYQNAYGNLYVKPSDIYAAPFDTFAVGLLPTLDPASAMAKLPAGADGNYRTLFDAGDGQPYLFNASFAAAARTDASPLTQAMQRNSLLGWKPTAPMALCNGALDPTVQGFNSVKAVQSFAQQGVTVPHWDLEDANSVPPAIKQAFDALKQQTLLAKGQAGMIKAYHAGLVPPFCFALAKGYFDQIVAAAP